MTRGRSPLLFARHEWQDDAACRGMDQNLFFPSSGSAQFAYPRAQAICAECPVRMACLQYAIALPERRGVWGGLTPEARRPLIDRYRRLNKTSNAERRVARSN